MPHQPLSLEFLTKRPFEMTSLKHSTIKKENRKRSNTNRPHPPHKLNKRYWDELRANGQPKSPAPKPYYFGWI
ncbi:unnamed protein product, partial [Mesorhabditis belari]|uniref:Uncharacterized protein n=1 Tax=Mesorhabditis belari TaxID=2138241 RepID=A0AAF3EQU9_9BILA